MIRQEIFNKIVIPEAWNGERGEEDGNQDVEEVRVLGGGLPDVHDLK